jgi:hypothetical protein
MTRWLEEVKAAVRTQIPKNDKPGPAVLEKFGPARRIDDDGWYEMSTDGNPIRIDELNELTLAGDSVEDGEPTFRVLAVVDAGTKLKVQVGAHAPAVGLSLWAIKAPRGMLAKSLLKALEAIEDCGLADRLAAGRLDALPATVPQARGLTGDHARALHACTTPGVRAIWGPPGTGKTTVLGHAVDELLNLGLRVLLVSGTNVAVDNVLSVVLRSREPEPGELIRVGTPHLVAIATDHRVSLPSLVQARLTELSKRCDAVAQELIKAGWSPELAKLAELEDRLADYDHDRYLAALRRVDNEATVAAATAAHREAERRWEEATGQVAAAENHVAQARYRWQAAEPAMALLDQADQIRRELDGYAAQAQHRHADAQTKKAEYEAAVLHRDTERTGFLAIVRNRSNIKEAGVYVDFWKKEMHAAVAAARQAAMFYEQQQTVLGQRIANLEHDAAPIDRAAVRALDAAIQQAQNRLNTATRAAADRERGRQQMLRALRTAEREGQPTEADQALIAAADRAGRPADFERLRLQRILARPVEERVQRLTKEHEALVAELAKQRNTAELEIIAEARLIATTLARLHLNRAVATGDYDVVLIDEAAAASLPDVLLAASKANRTVALLGDFCQLSPIPPREMRKRLPPDRPKRESVTKWFTWDCFKLAGIEQPEDAIQNPGCVSMMITHRFGPHIVELANRIAYDGHLRSPNGSDRADAEIVLITTDELGDMAEVRTPGSGRGRWWPAGSVIAHALAQQHRDRGESVGIVTPYQAQRRATRDYLQDAGALGDGVEVGTTHAFQGREFDAVVLDLVEDGRFPGWAAKGSFTSSDSYVRDGARLINVGATRARRRLYVVTSWKTVRTAENLTAMAAIRDMQQAGLIRGVRASRLLGVDDSIPVAEFDPLARDIHRAFAKHVEVDGIYDEQSYFPAVREAINNAANSIYLWSPWFRERQEMLLPHLAAAKNRGVRIVVFVSDTSDNEKHKDPRQEAIGLARLADLGNSVTTVMRIKMMHQKILILDEETTFLGSLNTLAHSAKAPRREIMVRHRGRRYAERILTHERAATFAEPQYCPEGKEQLEIRRYKKGWVWACPNHKDVRRPIPDDAPERDSK